MKTGKALLDAVRSFNADVGARQLIVVAVDHNGKFAVCSYGESRAECRAAAPLCNAIADRLISGELPNPSPVRAVGFVDASGDVYAGTPARSICSPVDLLDPDQETFTDAEGRAWKLSLDGGLPALTRDGVTVATLEVVGERICVHSGCGAVVRIPAAVANPFFAAVTRRLHDEEA